MALKPTSSFMKVLLLLAIFSLTPITLFILYTRTGGPESQKEMQLQRNLRYAFMQGVDAIDMAPLTPWPYIRVCAFKNGLSREEIATILGFDYENFQELHWLHMSDYWTLLFIDKEREVSWGTARPVTPVRIPKKDLADLKLPEKSKGQCITRDGRLEVTRRTVPVGESPVTVEFVDSTAD